MTTAPSHATVLAPAYHDDAETNGPNSFGKLAVERASGRLGWTWPLVFCVIRFPLLVAGFAVAYWVYRSTDGAHAGELAQAFTRYDAPLLADVVCIGLLLWRVRREGMRLRDLVRPTRQHLVRDLIRGVLILAPFACLVVVVIVFYAILSPSSALRGVGAGTGAASLLNPLGTTWHVAITLLIIPISSGITEELVYRGYALPRCGRSLDAAGWQSVARLWDSASSMWRLRWWTGVSR